jgi:hypothetical protein
MHKYSVVSAVYPDNKQKEGMLMKFRELRSGKFILPDEGVNPKGTFVKLGRPVSCPESGDRFNAVSLNSGMPVLIEDDRDIIHVSQ